MKIGIAVVIAAAAAHAFAHSGGTDKLGCHTDHKTDLWHCH